MEPAPFDEIMAAVCALRGRDGVRELGYHVMKSGFTKVLEPIIHLSLSVLGASPASLLSRAHLMLAVISRGVEMTWTPSNRHSGTMRVRCEQPIPEITWAGWEGCLLYGLELARTSGTVSPARVAADGCSCEIDVNWTMK